MLYINGRFLTQQVTGVQRFALEISKELIKVRDDIIFLVPHKKLVSSFEGKCNIEVVSGEDGHYWEQLTLPMFLKKNNDPLLLN
ncbi:glycosyltransferase family 1 protein, partial [Klebsiella pneumoniae]